MEKIKRNSIYINALIFYCLSIIYCASSLNPIDFNSFITNSPTFIDGYLSCCGN